MKTTTDNTDETDATADGTNLHWVIAALAAEIRNNPFNGATLCQSVKSASSVVNKELAIVNSQWYENDHR